MMSTTKLFFAVAFLGLAYCAVEEVPILSQEFEVDPQGAYHHSFESGDGVKVDAVGELKQVDKEVVGVASGSFSYTSDDGKTYQVRYVADENGYQPTGDHLPVAPEIPPSIQRSLDYLATAPPPEELLKKIF